MLTKDEEKIKAIFKYLKQYVPHNFPYAYNVHWEIDAALKYFEYKAKGKEYV